MENLINFFTAYGLAITLIALAGIVILGILKYCNLFKKLEEGKRHYIYLTISVGLSLIGTAIYLLVVGQFEFNYFLLIASAIYALNQTFYNIFKITPINTLFRKILDFLFKAAEEKVDKEKILDKTEHNKNE